MWALTPCTAGAFAASSTARSRALGAGFCAPVRAAWAMPAPATTATSTATIASRRGEDAVRSLLIVEAVVRAELERSLTGADKGNTMRRIAATVLAAGLLAGCGDTPEPTFGGAVEVPATVHQATALTHVVADFDRAYRRGDG